MKKLLLSLVLTAALSVCSCAQKEQVNTKKPPLLEGIIEDYEKKIGACRNGVSFADSMYYNIVIGKYEFHKILINIEGSNLETYLNITMTPPPPDEISTQSDTLETFLNIIGSFFMDKKKITIYTTKNLEDTLYNYLLEEYKLVDNLEYIFDFSPDCEYDPFPCTYNLIGKDTFECILKGRPFIH